MRKDEETPMYSVMEKSEKKGCNLTNIEWHDEWHYGIAQQHPESKISKVQHAGNKNMIK